MKKPVSHAASRALASGTRDERVGYCRPLKCAIGVDALQRPGLFLEA